MRTHGRPDMSDLNRTLKQVGRQISEWMREGGGSASEWWEDKNAVHSRLARIRRLIGQRREVTAGIGAKVYTLHRREKVRNTDLVADCRKLDDIGEEIEVLKIEIEEIRDRERGLTQDDADLTDESPVVDEEDVDTSIAVEVEIVEAGDDDDDNDDDDAYDVAPAEDAGDPDEGDTSGPGDEAGATDEQ